MKNIPAWLTEAPRGSVNIIDKPQAHGVLICLPVVWLGGCGPGPPLEKLVGHCELKEAMLQFVDTIIAVAKESVKTFIYESLNNTLRFINGVSAFLLTFLPGKTNILEGLTGWELRPTLHAPRFPYWMENGVSSFNEFIHKLSPDYRSPSSDCLSEEDACQTCATPSSSPSSSSSWQSTRVADDRGSQPLLSQSVNKVSSLRNHGIHHTMDRRRGVIEDLHLAIEILIEAIFDRFHKAASFLLSPSEVINAIYRCFSFQTSCNGDCCDGVLASSLPADTTRDNSPSLAEKKTATFRQSLNTDARTCQDLITELGYPYEAIRVVTADGYVLLLERIPRRDSRRAVYLQHGVLDTSLGWVSNGVVGSPAFAAYDQGFDVFLGNFRGLASREHVNKNISSRKYWRYSINEHGTKDVPAMVEKIHQVKTSELRVGSNRDHGEGEEEHGAEQPYTLAAICHSLGGAAMLMYIITARLVEKKRHRLSKLILLSPAGFHHDSNFVFTMFEYLFLKLAPILAPAVPGFYIPTRFFRMLLNKMARDFHNYPAVGGLVQTLIGYVAGGDSSNWVGVLGLPHYNMDDMPGVSFYVACHLAQMKRAGKFAMFDYGSSSSNMEAYGSPVPLDLGDHYRLIDVPVALVAGCRDNVIRPSMVRKHYQLMKEGGVDVSYQAFEYAHLDFTFSHREELLAYVMSQLRQ